MNYQRIYNEIINRGKIRKNLIDSYTEKHHIIPKCIGGTDDIKNIVILTAREHFICHWLLSRIYNIKELNYAFWAMCNIKTKHQKRYIPSSRIYNEAKEKFSHYQKNRIVSIETRLKMSNSQTGKTPWNKGLKFPEQSEKRKGIGNPRYGIKTKHSEETKRKIRLKFGVICCDLTTGIFFESIEEACKNYQISRKKIFKKISII